MAPKAGCPWLDALGRPLCEKTRTPEVQPRVHGVPRPQQHELPGARAAAQGAASETTPAPPPGPFTVVCRGFGVERVGVLAIVAVCNRNMVLVTTMVFGPISVIRRRRGGHGCGRGNVVFGPNWVSSHTHTHTHTHASLS